MDVIKCGKGLRRPVITSLANDRAWANREIKVKADIHALALSLQNLLIGLNVLSKVVRNEADLWQVAKTTLRGLDLLAET